jgi:CRP/FNR family transcriptional regulator, anaerobic regulatory protein
MALPSFSTLAQHRSLVPATSAQSGRLERGALWSTLADVCALLRIPMPVRDEAVELLFQHRRIKQGQYVMRIGESFNALYVVKCGFLKTQMLDSEGNERVLAFPMQGDVLGSDGIYQGRYSAEVVALSDCEVIVLRCSQLKNSALEQVVLHAISREIMQEHANTVALTALHSDAKLARFLVMQSQRHAALGYSAKSFLLRMTRRDIGSHLGLTLETVSRGISALAAAGTISVDQRHIEILDSEVLGALQTPGNMRTATKPRAKSTRTTTVSKGMLPHSAPMQARLFQQTALAA